MGKPTGFVEFGREDPKKRPVEERVRDWDVVYLAAPVETLQRQGARCMDCGIPFCQEGCPLGNLIPDWNDLVFRGLWRDAIDRLHATNNFPEFTGWLCPAPCEDSCVLAINDDPVIIKEIEKHIIERAFREGWLEAHPPQVRTGKKVAVVGSGPAGLAGAQQLNRAGHSVTVFERDDRLGGLLRYGIPDFKMDKKYIDRRIALMEEEGVVFLTNKNVGVDPTAAQLREEFDAVLLAAGALLHRDLPIPGRELEGIHYGMEYLTLQNRRLAGDVIPDEEFITAKDKRVVVIGGGDTGADCVGTAHRQGARSVTQFQYHPRPPDRRDDLKDPWPLYPRIFRTSPMYEEGGKRCFSIQTKAFCGKGGRVRRIRTARVDERRDEEGNVVFDEIPGTEEEIEADLVLLALGFAGPDCHPLLEELNLERVERGDVRRDERWMTSVPGFFVAGDMMRGASLVVWAIADGRSAARAIDEHLMGESDLPAPLE
ncbi:MAG: glutamate synthase subunit beta [bacterium]